MFVSRRVNLINSPMNPRQQQSCNLRWFGRGGRCHRRWSCCGWGTLSRVRHPEKNGSNKKRWAFGWGEETPPIRSGVTCKFLYWCGGTSCGTVTRGGVEPAQVSPGTQCSFWGAFLAPSPLVVKCNNYH